MKKIGILAVLLLAVAILATAGCVTQEEKPIDYPTALIGDWKSDGSYESDGGVAYTMVYSFKEDNTGTLSAQAGGTILTSIDIFWGYVDKNGYIVGYTTTGTGDYLYISDDGKTLINEFGETFKRI